MSKLVTLSSIISITGSRLKYKFSGRKYRVRIFIWPGLRMKYLVVLSLLCSVLAQDTYNCPDGWEKEEDRSGCRCFWFQGRVHTGDFYKY